MNTCKICGQPIRQSAATGGWFHTQAGAIGAALADDLTAVAEAVGVLR